MPTPSPTPTPAAQRVSANILNFTHQNVSVKAGTTVVWTNGDSDPHTASYGTPGNIGPVFRSPVLNQGESYSFTFTSPGTFPYFCEIHTDMRATVTVTP